SPLNEQLLGGVALLAAARLFELGCVVAQLVFVERAGLMELTPSRAQQCRPVQGGHLLVQLLDDHRCAPGRVLFAPEDIAVDVVAYVEHASPFDAEPPLEITNSSPLVVA